MNLLFKTLAAAALLAAGVGQAWAQRIDVRATGTYQYDDKQASAKTFATSKATEDEKSKAVAAARQSAWKLYVSGLSPSRQQAVFKNEKTLLEHLDDFIMETVVLDASKDSEAHSLKVVVRFAFNDEKVSQTVQALSVGSGDPAASGDASRSGGFTFLFIARKATLVTQFDARRTSINENETATAKVADGGVTDTNRVTTGGSTLRKEDVVSYQVESSQDLDTAVGENITTSGIEYTGYDDIVANCNGLAPKKFRDEFASSDEMSPETRKQVIAAIKSCEIKYFAFGTVDSGVASIDPVTGMKRVFVSVRAQIWDLSPKLPRKVGSVGPKQYSGLGPDQSTANRNALNAAARDVSRNLVDQLNAKGIR